jgi:glycerate 2-kinase
MITEMDDRRFATHSLQDPRILRILAAALRAVDPFTAVQKHLPQMEGRVYGLGIGKAAIPMMDALAARTALRAGLAVTKFAPDGTSRAYEVMEGGHPVPDERSVQAGERVLQFVSSLREEDILVCLISGGGSALVTAPDVLLGDLQTLTSLLLSSGAPIEEINILRRQLDRVKGGGLARATRARIISLILSDVIGNPLEAIASGPTVPDPTTPQEALAILKKYQIEEHVPASILQALTSGSSGQVYEESSGLGRVQNIIIGDNRTAALAARRQAEDEGISAEILTNALQGEARQVGGELARQLRAECSRRARPFCLIAGGETTVRVTGDGKGGRNQEVALGAVDELDGGENVMLIALATDGDDGPTDAAGAVATGESARRARALEMRAADYLSRNNAYVFFEKLGDLLRTGPTGTNVNDLIFLFAI